MKLTATLLLFLFLGCRALLPIEHQESASVKATESLFVEQEKTFQRALESTNAAPAREDIHISTRTSIGAGSKSSSVSSLLTSIPLGVKLAILAFALGLLWLVIWLYRRTSPAVDAAFRAGDKAIASAISHVEQAIATATDHSELSKLNAQRAHLEKERGKLRGTK